ncbi:MAG: ADP-forming succinate--CoA ligase subunit beta [Desulfohalobiaceae bacterium]|nr:ADP-forming succinate--CoA ligase subunit beta [Desulfohalobiaceae bacterium]
MKIHEYQAKEIFARYGIPVPAGGAAFSVEEAVSAAEDLGSYPVVLKAQIHAGGRGKGGGVQLARSREEVQSVASSLLSMNLVTHQTGERGQPVNRLLVEQGLDIEQELYLSFLPDRSAGKIAVVASDAGGVDIEEVARESPERIVTVHVDPLLGMYPYHCRRVAFGLDLLPEARKEFMALLGRMYRIFIDQDCSLLEINPLVITTDKRVIALDAKAAFDDNGLVRHQNLAAYRDPEEEDPLERQASEYGLNYIKMEGNVGNMVNGAGLAMATMDLIKQAGAEPANFLDVGGGASAEMVENGFKILLSDDSVRAVLINIFGGILRCDVLARGVVQAAEQVGLNLPVVVRMEGTNVEEGRRILAESGLDLRTAGDVREAAQQIAAIVGGAPGGNA